MLIIFALDNNELDNIGNPDSFVWYGTRVSLNMQEQGLAQTDYVFSGLKHPRRRRGCTSTTGKSIAK